MVSTMNRRKKWILCLVAILCIFSVIGCGSKKETTNANSDKTTEQNNEKRVVNTEKENASVAMGRYVETACQTIEGLGYVSNLTMMEDGAISLLGTVTGEVYTSSDGGTSWESRQIKELTKILQEKNVQVTSGAVSPQGDIFFSYILWDQQDTSDIDEKYVYITKDGEVQEPKLTWGNKADWLRQITFDKEGNLYGLSVAGNVFGINVKEESTNKFFEFDSNLSYISVDGNYIMAIGDSVGYVYNIQDKNLIEDPTLKDFITKNINYQNIDGCCLAIDAQKEMIYIACGEGIYSHVIGGNVMEQLVSSEFINLGNQSVKPRGFILDGCGGFLIGYTNGEIDTYCYRDDIPTIPSKQVTIYSLYENKMIQQAICNYRKVNPDVYVKLEIGLTADSGLTKEDAIKKLNTSILAGDGPDLFVLDGLPMDSYVEKGVLQNLQGNIQEFNDQNYFMNIVNSYATSKGVYAVPVKFRIPLLAGNKERLNDEMSLATFSDMIQRYRNEDVETETMMYCYTPKEVLEKLQFGCSAVWMTKEGTIDEEILREYLTSAKKIYDAEMQNISKEMIESHKKAIQESSTMDTGRYSGMLNLSIQLNLRMMGEQQIAAGFIEGITDYQTLLAALVQDPSLTYQKLNLQSNNNFIPSSIIGVNAASDDKETAIAFFQSLFSKELQSCDVQEGFPIERNVFMDLANGKNVMESTFSASSRTGKEICYTLTIPTEQEMEALLELADSLTTPTLLDDTVLEVVESIGEKVVSGEIGIDEGIQEILQKVNLYIQE